MKKLGRILSSLFVVATIWAAGVSPGAQAASPNLIANPSVETASADPALPQSWQRGGWGTHQTTYSYLNSGYDGSRSLHIQVSSYTSGDAKWYFTPVTVQPGMTYTYSDHYKATATTQVVARWYDGKTYTYQNLGNTAASTTWRQFTSSFVAPATATQLTIFHLIKSVGTLTTDNFSLTRVEPVSTSRPLVSIAFDDGYSGVSTYAAPLLQKYGFATTQYIISNRVGKTAYMTLAQIKTLQTQGHEIASHTVSHPRLAQISSAQLQTELADSKAQLESWLGVPVTNLAYPYGSYNTAVKTATAQYYASGRSVEVGFNSKATLDRYNIRIQKVINTTTTAQIAQWVAQTQATNTWLVLTYHSIDPNTVNPPSGAQYNNSPAQLDSHLAAIKASGVTVKTMQQALAEFTSQP